MNNVINSLFGGIQSVPLYVESEQPLLTVILYTGYSLLLAIIMIRCYFNESQWTASQLLIM